MRPNLRDNEKLKKEIYVMYDAMLDIMLDEGMTPEEAFYETILAVLAKGTESIEKAYESGYSNGYETGSFDTLVNASELLAKFSEDLYRKRVEEGCDCDDCCMTGECLDER